MKVLFFSFPGFADCGLPMVKAMQDKGIDITYIIEVTPACLSCNLFSIKKQIQINAIIPATDYPELKVYEKYVDMNKIFILNRTTKAASGWSGLRMAIKLINFIYKEKFDIVHTDYQPYMWLTILYFFRKKLVFTVHDPIPHTGSNEDKSIRGLFRRLALLLSKRLVLLNKKQGIEFQRTYKINPCKISYSALGVYESMRILPVKTNKEGNHNVLFFGRISPYKGIEYLCEAMLKVHTVVPDVKLTIAGSGSLYFDYSRYKDLPYIQLQNRFIEMEELATMLEECDVCVCPYIDATQSGVVMSAFCFKKPVIATNVGGLPEMIDDGVTGIIVPPKDSDALADSIIELLVNDSKREKMKRCIEELYLYGEKSWASIANKYIDCYNKVIIKK